MPAKPTTFPLRGVRVLIIEDAAELLLLYGALLESGGAWVDSTTPAHVKAFVANTAYDAVICDLAVRGAADVANLLKALEPSLGRHVPVAAVVDPGDRRAPGFLRALGFDAVVRKPIAPRELTDFCRRAAGLGKSAQRAPKPSPAMNEVVHAAWKLKPPVTPSTSSNSPAK